MIQKRTRGIFCGAQSSCMLGPVPCDCDVSNRLCREVCPFAKPQAAGATLRAAQRVKTSVYCQPAVDGTTIINSSHPADMLGIQDGLSDSGRCGTRQADGEGGAFLYR